jgi:hypothetical protein
MRLFLSRSYITPPIQNADVVDAMKRLAGLCYAVD